jgi:hypothetical protein
MASMVELEELAQQFNNTGTPTIKRWWWRRWSYSKQSLDEFRRTWWWR